MDAIGDGWPPGSDWLETGVAELVRHGVPEEVVRGWTITDDRERSDALAAATDDELHDMIEGTSEEWDRWASSFAASLGGPSPALAAILWEHPESMSFPLGKVAKFLENGPEDSTFFFGALVSGAVEPKPQEAPEVK